jgi:hypothetical protein
MQVQAPGRAGSIPTKAGGPALVLNVPSRDTDSRGVRVQGLAIRRWLATTPGRMRLASVLLVAVVLTVGVTATLTAHSRANAARAVGLGAAPQLLASERLYGALADADAAASTAYLQAGKESPDLLRRYDDDLASAGRDLAEVGRGVGTTTEAGQAVADIAEQLPVYSGLIESARANNRQGFAVGAAYLRQASTLMRSKILNDSTVVYAQAAGRLSDGYARGTSGADVGALVLASAGALLLFALVQLFLARRVRRLLNVGLVVGLSLVVVALGSTLLLVASEGSALASARRDGSDAVQTLSTSRILTLRAYNDDNLALIARGNGAAYVTDFDALVGTLGGADGRDGLLAEASQAAGRTGSTRDVSDLQSRFTVLDTAHVAVRGLDDGGQYQSAVEAAVTTEASAAAAMDTALQSQIDRTSRILAANAADAREGFSFLLVVVPLLIVGAAAAVLVGFRARIEEYR